MCGIVAVVMLKNETRTDIDSEQFRASLAQSIGSSLDQIQHRGPDSQNFWISSDNRVGRPLPLNLVKHVLITAEKLLDMFVLQ